MSSGQKKTPNTKKKPRAHVRGRSHTKLGSIYRRYTSQGKGAAGLRDFLVYLCYRVGFAAEKACIFAADRLTARWEVLLAAAVRLADTVYGFSSRLFSIMMDDLGEPLRVLRDAWWTVRKIVNEGRENKKSSVSDVTGYIVRGVKKNRRHTSTIVSYVVPFLAALVFFGTVRYVFSRDYGMNVFINDENVGTIKNYAVLESADKMIENQLVSTDGQIWDLNAKVKVTGLSGKQTLDARQLSNNILNASNEDIVTATGLYVDGQFSGAVVNSERLRDSLNSMKAPYENGDPNRTVSFVQDVSLVDGIYFTSSIVSDTKLAEMVQGEVSGEKRYTVVKGDSPSLIASKNGITLKTLYSLNPGLEGGGLWVGDELIVSASVPFLQVKYTERTVRNVEIPYKTITEKNNSMNLGTTKVSQQGEVGNREEVVDSLYIDGVFQGETIVQSTVTKEPVNKIIQSGTLWNGTVITGGSGRCIWPVPGYTRLSRGFVGRYPRHDGLDIPAPYGTPIVAADTGVVVEARYTNRGYGIYCVINHGSYSTRYAHCSALYVSTGQQVSQGQVIARVGSTGWSTGNHCHFEVMVGKVRYNPYSWM